MDETGKYSVLVVDDDSSDIMALTHILSPEYTVYVVKDGKNAIKAAGKYVPDVILLDIIMPGLDGYDVITALKDMESTKNIPVIFVTGLSNADDEKKGLLLGAADYITKPFSSAIVKLRVKNQIRILEQTRLIIDSELAEKSNRAKIEFLSRMSHEMLTPMNAIIGMTQLVDTAGDLRKARECAEEIRKAARHLSAQLNDLLDISGGNTGAFVPADTVFTFPEMFRAVLREIRRDLEEKQQGFSCHLDARIPEPLIGDEKRLAQVISNLLGNSVKFTPAGGEIRFSACVLREDAGTVTLQVETADNGIGISKGKHQDIFSPLEQADGSLTRRYGGIGLGLAISKYIVEMMGGEIWVESEPGKGTVFIFTCVMRKG
ncbi:MAG: hybrid sensor histidine kinase/response regulator [Oscillospiraceae bacterium]|nr:hybrid sensor histidine kinase/response regulator [Oscillospiraceae bacterium]